MKRLCFGRNHVATLTAILVLLIMSSVGVAADDRPNILFIITDQQSADVMSCRMGGRYINTPAMDSLAASGTLFSQAYSTNPLCMPARSAFFTGQYPHITGVMNNGGTKRETFSKFVSMGTYLRDAGYTTAYSGKWHLCYNTKDESVHGFEILKSNSKDLRPGENNYDSRISHAAVKFLERKQDRPFLLVVSLLNPHNICEWARRAAGRKQNLNCGEIGEPPTDLDLLPPPPANLEVPKNEPDSMVFSRP